MNRKELEVKVFEATQKLDPFFADIAHNLAEVLADDEFSAQNLLMSKKAFLDRFEQEIKGELEETKERIKNGPLILLRALEEKTGSDEIEPEILSVFLQIIQLAEIIALERVHFINMLSENKTLQELAGIDAKNLEKLYEVAKFLYEKNRFKDACEAFGFLTILNAKEPIFWQGLANSEFKLQNYHGALFAYAFISRLKPDDYLCHLFSSRCYEALGEIKHASNALEIALHVLGNNPELPHEKELIELQIKHLANKK